MFTPRRKESSRYGKNMSNKTPKGEPGRPRPGSARETLTQMPLLAPRAAPRHHNLARNRSHIRFERLRHIRAAPALIILPQRAPDNRRLKPAPRRHPLKKQLRQLAQRDCMLAAGALVQPIRKREKRLE